MNRFALICLLTILAAPASAQKAGHFVNATGTRLGGDAAGTRLIVDLNGPVKPRVFTLADPYRVIIDLPDVLFGTDPLPHEERGLISAYRYGLIAPGRSRIVIDAKQPVKVAEVRSVDAAEGQPARLVIELVPTGREDFLKNMQAQAPGVEQLPPAPTPKVSQDAADTRPVVVIDPGHGGIDTGAKGAGGEEEKDVVLEFARTLNARLIESGRYRVTMTRSDDSFVALADRVRIARENGAHLLLSIHADSLSDPFGVRGATVYTLSDTASDAEAARLAEKENRADVIAGVDLTAEPDEVAGILIDLATRETKSFSTRFAHTLVGSVKQAMRMNKNPLRSAGFLVLKAPDVPSALLELGYMSNKEDLKLLMSKDWRDKAANAMVQAVDGFFGKRGASEGGSSGG
jgi:N-acetylmuramoyl-L-alanine amidase